MQSNRGYRPGTICQLCEFHLTSRRLPARQFQAIAKSTKDQLHRTPRTLTIGSRQAQEPVSSRWPLAILPKRYQHSRTQITGVEAAISIGELQQEADKFLKHERVPSEEEVLAVLRKLQKVADQLPDEGKNNKSELQTRDGTPASALLSLDGKPAPSISPGKTAEVISNLAYKIVKHPTVFISPKILEVYTRTQIQLQRPSTLPEIFDLYASKPSPQSKTHPIKYTTPNISAAANAIPYALATDALTSAITTKDLSTALSLIETSFRAPAHRRAKAIKSGLPPLLGFALAPLAAYAAGTHFSLLTPTTLDPRVATPVAAAGVLVYLGCVGTMGFVAVTTANDQMRRVTWVDGTRLWERWVREEERAAVDRVAVAWGLRPTERWGEEEGPEWEFLKEWVGVRGMVLDRVSLMEGME